MNFTQEMSSDLTVHAGGTYFSMHKFPLASKCGYIRKLVSESNNPDVSKIDLPDIPGGEEAFELAAKFCYGINFEISSGNIAMLRCVAEYLEMTEETAVGNLVGRTEAYLNEVALKSLSAAVSILHSLENFLPMAEEVKLVSRCIDAIAYLACKDGQFCTSNKEDRITESVDSSPVFAPKTTVDWWAEDLTGLRIDIFQRVLIALIARGFKQSGLGQILTLYAQKALRGVEKLGMGRKKMEPRQEHEKRVIVETITSLLPREKSTVSVTFLSLLLRSAIHLDTTMACRHDLEKRMALQLGQAVLDDLLIPSYSVTGETLFDVETVKRVVMNFLENEVEGKIPGHNADAEENCVSPPLSEMEKVGKLMESYLAEIASDRNVTVSKFISVAEMIPVQSRITEDGMYRAVDIYLKAHPALSNTEKKKICNVMDCNKLSPEACAHAAQNHRLSVQTILQVLYHEQQRLRDTINNCLTSSEFPALLQKPNSFNPVDIIPVSDDFSKLKKENHDLKLELLKMKTKLKDIEKPIDKSHLESPCSESSLSSNGNKKRVSRLSFISTVSKKLWRLYPFLRVDGITAPSSKPRRTRRHSIS